MGPSLRTVNKTAARPQLHTTGLVDESSEANIEWSMLVTFRSVDDDEAVDDRIDGDDVPAYELTPLVFDVELWVLRARDVGIADDDDIDELYVDWVTPPDPGAVGFSERKSIPRHSLKFSSQSIHVV